MAPASEGDVSGMKDLPNVANFSDVQRVYMAALSAYANTILQRTVQSGQAINYYAAALSPVASAWAIIQS